MMIVYMTELLIYYNHLIYYKISQFEDSNGGYAHGQSEWEIEWQSSVKVT